jgi:lipoate-protein ligase B
VPYLEAWAVQERAHAEVLAGGEERVLFVEHAPVITFGRRPGLERNLLASDERLATLGVEVVYSDRGGDITFHGPGQLVAYPIIRLTDHARSVGGFVRRLEETVIAALREMKIAAQKDACAIGVWVPDETGGLAKICALGVRIRRGVSMHGIALNVTTDLSYFDLIVPCGLAGRRVTSIARVLAEKAPTMQKVKDLLGAQFRAGFPPLPEGEGTRTPDPSLRRLRR